MVNSWHWRRSKGLDGMESVMILSYNDNVVTCTKTSLKILHVQKGRKTRKRTRKSRKWAKPGAFWVLERLKTGQNRWWRMRTLAKEAITFRPDSVSPAGSVGPGRSPQGCRPPRHALRGAQPLLVAKTSRSLTKKARHRKSDT